MHINQRHAGRDQYVEFGPVMRWRYASIFQTARRRAGQCLGAMRWTIKRLAWTLATVLVLVPGLCAAQTPSKRLEELLALTGRNRRRHDARPLRGG